MINLPVSQHQLTELSDTILPKPPKLRFGVIGSGYRAEWYLKTAALVGSDCTAVGFVSRDSSKREQLSARWQLAAYAEARELLDSAAPDFLLVAVSGQAAATVILNLLPLGVPLLVETPPAANLDDLGRLWLAVQEREAKLQVAEQYWLQPLQQARLAVLRAGLIGRPSWVQVSVNHSYHNISLLRKYLGVGFAEAEIRATALSAPVVAGPDRAGLPTAEIIIRPEQRIALFDFGDDRRGLFDYESNQHRSWIRSERLLVRGERGEIADSRIAYLEAFNSALYGTFQRIQTGGDSDFEGYYLKGIQLNGRWLYRNPTLPARLSDEEISQAACLFAMKTYVDTGRSFYDLAEAAQDQYLALKLTEAISSQHPVVAKKPVWG